MDADKRIARGIFILGAVTFSWFFGGAGWNQGAQFDLARAIVERHTLYIDGFDENTGDVAPGAGGHRYINKVPGVSFLAVVPYAFFHEAVVLGISHASPRTIEWFCTAATCGVCGALIGVVLYLHGRRRYGAAPRDALAVALAVLFGTIVFAYSTMLFAHVPAALFLLLAVVHLDRHPFAAGAAVGMATICFDVCGAGAVLLAILSRKWRFIAGGVPFAIVLGLYQWACFGSPFRPPLEHSTFFTQRGLLFGVLRLPRLDALIGITVSPVRGLFFISPFLLFAFFGFGRMAKRDVVAVAGITAIFFAVIAGFNGWHGGWAFGPRYLLPVVPLMAIPMLAAAGTARPWVRALWTAAAVVSIAINFVATAVDPMPPPTIHNPTMRYHFPAFLRGEVSAETRRGFYYDMQVKEVADTLGSGNLGEPLFERGKRVSVLPIALWMIAGTIWLFTLAREPSPRPSLQPRTL